MPSGSATRRRKCGAHNNREGLRLPDNAYVLEVDSGGQDAMDRREAKRYRKAFRELREAANGRVPKDAEVQEYLRLTGNDHELPTIEAKPYRPTHRGPMPGRTWRIFFAVSDESGLSRQDRRARTRLERDILAAPRRLAFEHRGERSPALHAHKLYEEAYNEGATRREAMEQAVTHLAGRGE